MTHYDAWNKVAGDVLVVLAYVGGPVFWISVGISSKENKNEFTPMYLFFIALIFTVVSNMISSGAIK